ncbi:DUF3396 domain-containing protein [Paracoccus suum]|uniref:DUF3396 domain-containing protein n=1 Tax=Paracoccus suum TaxID=2259340 RepID=A0A344PIL4_9RHOB|nr:type VI immunity family protein [Paracoccus suum]AXC49219.1 DUF3396 domain-containing protein [Paracoccus suum]
MTPKPLNYEGEPFAGPAFKTLAWIEGSLADPSMVERLVPLFDLYVERFGEVSLYLMQGGRGKKGRPTKATAKALAAAREWLLTPPHSFPTTLRMLTYDEDQDLTIAPHFCLEEGVGMVMVEFDQGPEGPDLALADQVVEMLSVLPMICGVVGYGFYLPENLDSLIFNLPQTTARYRCAIEIQLSGPDGGIRKERSFFPFDRYPNVESGIADIGWQTLIGPSFLDRIPDLGDLAEVPGVTVEKRGNTVIIKAGPAPIWGDVKRGEDISAYREIARVLADVRYPFEVARGSLFGDAIGDAEYLDRVAAYLTRFNKEP